MSFTADPCAVILLGELSDRKLLFFCSQTQISLIPKADKAKVKVFSCKRVVSHNNISQITVIKTIFTHIIYRRNSRVNNGI